MTEKVIKNYGLNKYGFGSEPGEDKNTILLFVKNNKGYAAKLVIAVKPKEVYLESGYTRPNKQKYGYGTLLRAIPVMAYPNKTITHAGAFKQVNNNGTMRNINSTNNLPTSTKIVRKKLGFKNTGKHRHNYQSGIDPNRPGFDKIFKGIVNTFTKRIQPSKPL